MKKINIVADFAIPFIDECLTNISNVVLANHSNITNSFLIKNNAEALAIRSTVKVNKTLLDNTNVKFVATATSGYDHFDVEYLQNRGIAYFHSPGCNANSVAEYVIYSILKWIITKNIELKNINLGIIGFGNIGKLVARYFHTLDINIYVNDPPLKDENFIFPDYVHYCELDEIFEKCNVITNHVPLTKSGNYPTQALITGKLLSKLKDNSLLIHASRGGVIVESDLFNIMKVRKLSTAIDVWENEPDFNSELANSSILATPHIAGYSYNGKLNGTMQVLKNIENYFGIKPNYDILNAEMNKYKTNTKLSKDNLQDIFKKLNDNRRFEDDFARMREASKLDKAGKQAFFQEIRKNYPKRYETLNI
ncbi:MAG: 4-phosphoerythronate dehydrogenase [Candidatus Kapabacteria bacterium]|nr:4-phosphoerythronate dehydrogenase [Candidatus Kapabacteria bacterium]